MTHTHLIGIGGSGLSAIARILLERGEKVSGSDQQLSPLAAELQTAGAEVTIGHSPQNIQSPDVVVRSSAVPEDNVEVLAAQKAGIPVLRRADYLGQLLEGFATIAVAGSHGKTTTTSMIAWILTAMNQRPSFIVGGVVQNLGANAHSDSGQYFVIEADEYDHMFWGLNPKFALVTNVEHDHPDFFTTPESFVKAFEGFVDRIPADGVLVACIDDPGAKNLLNYAQQQDKASHSYSMVDMQADYTARNLDSIPGSGYRFDAWRGEEQLASSALQVPGEHNVLNALGAMAVADLLGLENSEVAQALTDFRGAGRRFEIVGEAAGVTVIDDYGHHPTEIKATLEAARARYPDRRLWAVWQPHTYSRTLQLLAEFASAFDLADKVLVSNVYPARETQPEDFSHEDVLDAFQHPQARWSKTNPETAQLLISSVEPGDVVIVFSAGDATQISAELVAALSKN